MADKTITGTLGYVQSGGSQLPGITKWTLTKTAHVSEWASSDTGGYKASKAGVKQAKGTIEWKFDSTAAAALVEGAQLTLQLGINETIFWTVPVTIGEVSPSVDVDSGDVVAATANWTGNGAYTEPSFS